MCLSECLWKRLVFEPVDWGISPSPRWVSIIQSVEVLNRTKRRRKDEFTLSVWAETSNFSCPQTLALLILGPLDSDWDLTIGSPYSPILRPSHSEWIVSLPFLAFQLSDGRSWDFSIFITMWANSYNKFSFIYINIYPIGSVSLEDSKIIMFYWFSFFLFSVNAVYYNDWLLCWTTLAFLGYFWQISLTMIYNHFNMLLDFGLLTFCWWFL